MLLDQRWTKTVRVRLLDPLDVTRAHQDLRQTCLHYTCRPLRVLSVSTYGQKVKFYEQEIGRMRQKLWYRLVHYYWSIHHIKTQSSLQSSGWQKHGFFSAFKHAIVHWRMTLIPHENKVSRLLGVASLSSSDPIKAQRCGVGGIGAQYKQRFSHDSPYLIIASDALDKSIILLILLMRTRMALSWSKQASSSIASPDSILKSYTQCQFRLWDG